MNVIDLLIGGAGGGIIGTVGTFMMKWQEGKIALANKKLDHEHELAIDAQELTALETKLKHETRIAEISYDTEVEKGAAAGFVASQEADTASYSSVDTRKSNGWLVLVDVVRGLMRPMLTVGLTVLNGYLAITLLGRMAESGDLAEQIIMSTATLAGMAISWWFGARSHVKS